MAKTLKPVKIKTRKGKRITEYHAKDKRGLVHRFKSKSSGTTFIKSHKSSF